MSPLRDLDAGSFQVVPRSELRPHQRAYLLTAGEQRCDHLPAEHSGTTNNNDRSVISHVGLLFFLYLGSIWAVWHCLSGLQYQRVIQLITHTICIINYLQHVP